MSYLRARADRTRALIAARGARNDLRAAAGAALRAYQAHPAPALAGAAGLGFALAQLRVGGGLVRAGMRIASGPAWQLIKPYLGGLR